MLDTFIDDSHSIEIHRSVVLNICGTKPTISWLLTKNTSSTVLESYTTSRPEDATSSCRYSATSPFVAHIFQWLMDSTSTASYFMHPYGHLYIHLSHQFAYPHSLLFLLQLYYICKKNFQISDVIISALSQKSPGLCIQPPEVAATHFCSQIPNYFFPSYRDTFQFK